MLLCSRHWEIWNFLSHCDFAISASQWSSNKCSSHWDDKMMCDTIRWHAYPHPYMFDTLQHLEMFVTLRRHIATFGNVCHIATSLCFVDCNVTMFITLWPYYVRHISTLYFHHIAMLCVHHSVTLLCLVDFNVTMFNTLWNLDFFVPLWLCNKCVTMEHQQIFITLRR